MPLQRLARPLVVVVATGALAGAAAAQTVTTTTAQPPARPQAPPACATAHHRQFDFWVGEWDVRRADGRLAGHNSIRRVYGGCVLEERYTGLDGYGGGSFNIFDAGRKRWHQTWVDNEGLLLELDGELRGSSMVLSGATVDGEGRTVHQRITWTPLEGGRVRQHWEQSTDGGAAWTTAFDGTYARRR